ncbi:MAG: type II toxin-antitoxin system mRNA interferase toxin, RelE/StbE family [Patescibacteria group bacterium]
MELRYSNKFKKQYKKLPIKIRKQFIERVDLFLIDSQNLILKIHKLSGEFQDAWSLNITGDIRAVFYKENNLILFIAIGSHSELYS